MERNQEDEVRDPQAMREEADKFKKLLAIQQRIGAERNIDNLVPLIVGEVSSLIGAERTSLFLVDLENAELQAKFAEGLEDKEVVIKLKMGIVGFSVLARRPVSITNAYDHPYFNPKIDQILKYKTNTILVVPVMDEADNVQGAIQLLNKHTGRFTEADMELALDEAERFRKKRIAQIAVEEAKAVLRGLMSRTGSERGSVFMLDEDGGLLSSVYSEGVRGKKIRLSLNLGIAGYVAVAGHPKLINDTASDRWFSKLLDLKTGFNTRSLLATPICTQNGETIGVLEVLNKKKGKFTEEDLQVLGAVASAVAITIENALLFEEHEKQFQSVLEVMAASIDAKDPLTAGHSVKVTEYATAIARELGFSEEETDVLRVAALLHDYGKLGIDDVVLKKPGKLNSHEYGQIKEHVVITRSILEKMHLTRKYKNVPNIASAHHECLDGSGYPEGLTMKEIPYMSKVIVVADIFEALTSDRAYRQAMPVEEAFNEIEKDAGVKYDTSVIAALKRYYEKKYK